MVWAYINEEYIERREKSGGGRDGIEDIEIRVVCCDVEVSVYLSCFPPQEGAPTRPMSAD